MAGDTTADAPWRVLDGGAIDRRARDGRHESLTAAGCPDVLALLSSFGTGGVERVTCLLMNGFARRGLHVRLAVVEAQGPLRGLLGDDIETAELGRRQWLPGRGLSLVAAIPRLVRMLKDAPPAVLLSPGNHTHVAAAIAHRLAGGRPTRLVVKITNPILKDRHGPVSRSLRTFFYRWVFDRADRILVISRQGERQIEQILPAAKSKTTFVHNPYIDDAPLDPRPAMAEAMPTVLAVGRLTAQKNYALLLRALARLADRPWRLVVLGEGPLEAMLRALAADLGIADRVEFKGFVADTAPFYRQAQLLALPSRWEDLPAVALEALAAGLPVVAARCSDGLAEIIEEAGHGDLVPVDDLDAFTRALDDRLGRPATRVPFAGAQRYRLSNGIADHVAAIGACPAAAAGSATGEVGPTGWQARAA